MGEGGGEESGKGILRHLRNLPGAKEAALGATLLSSEPALLQNLGHTSTVEAAEVNEQEPWQTTLKKLFLKADTGLNEFSEGRIQTPDGKSIAFQSAEGLTISNQGVDVPIVGSAYLSKAVYQRVTELIEDTSTTLDYCQMHTHGKNSARVIVQSFSRDARLSDFFGKLDGVDFNKRISMPPSVDDLKKFGDPPRDSSGIDTRDRTFVKLQEETGKRLRYVGATIDAVFLFYYGKFATYQAQDDFLRTLRVPSALKERFKSGVPMHEITRAQLNWLRFVNASNESSERLLQSTEYRELQYIYGRAGVQLRAVVREDATKEPPCAGPAYRP